MKQFKFLALLAAIAMMASLVADDSAAQRRGGGFRMMGGGGGSMVGLIRMEEVRKEIGLEGEDADKLADLAQDVQEELRAEMQDLFSNFRDMDEDERAEAQAELQKVVAKINADAEKEMKGILSEKQLGRLKELFVQQQGVGALQNDAVAKDLGISKEQKEKISKVQDELNQEMREEMREMFSGGGGGIDREAITEMREEFQEKIEKGVMDVLTDKQKESFAKMKGKEFKFPERRRGRGR